MIQDAWWKNGRTNNRSPLPLRGVWIFMNFPMGHIGNLKIIQSESLVIRLVRISRELFLVEKIRRRGRGEVYILLQTQNSLLLSIWEMFRLIEFIIYL